MVEKDCTASDLLALIEAIKRYRTSLDSTISFLKESVDICEQAFGQDPIMKKHISNLNEANLYHLKTASRLASDSIKWLDNKYWEITPLAGPDPPWDN